MVKQFLLIIGFLFSIQVLAQTGIGTTTPHASAKLDVSATNKGFLPPRVTLMSNTDVATIPSPAEGLLVYNLGSSGLQAGYYYWNSANWATIATGTTAGNAVIASDLVKLYHETYSTSSGKASSDAGYSFTVPASGRYEFNFNCTGWNSNGTKIKLTFNIRQGTSVLASDYHESYSSNAWVEYEGRVEVNLTAGVTYNAQVITTTGRRTADYDWDKIMYKMVAGNLPVNQHMADRNIQLNNNYLSNDGGNEGIRVDNSGNVGIGTTTPGDLLVVGSSIALHDGGDKLVGMGWSPGSGKAIVAGYPAEIRLNPSTGKLSLGTDPTSRSIGSSAGVQRRLTITSAGNIGIGTEDPTEKLEVSGNVKATNFIGTASSTSLFLLEANSNASYTLSGPWINDLCRYNNVNNTVNVPSSWFNISNYRFTPQKAGYWEIIASYDVYRNAESYLFIQKNGSTVAQTGTFNLISAMVNKIVYLNGSTDYITVVNQGGASFTRNQNALTSCFQARWVGE